MQMMPIKVVSYTQTAIDIISNYLRCTSKIKMSHLTRLHFFALLSNQAF